MTRLLSPVLAQIEPGYVGFGCPGCRDTHVIPVSEAHAPGRAWGFDGNAERPTFAPSIKIGGMKTKQDENWEWAGGWERDADGNPIPLVCHSFVRAGRIEFLSDCTHELAGQTVDLPPYPVPRRFGTRGDSDGDDGA